MLLALGALKCAYLHAAMSVWLRLHQWIKLHGLSWVCLGSVCWRHAGTSFIMLAAWFLSLLRSLLHPDALPWLKDPYDLEDESFRELWAAPLAAQLAGSVRSFVVVAAATVAAVHLPARLAARAGVLPLRFQLVRRTSLGRLTGARLGMQAPR